MATIRVDSLDFHFQANIAAQKYDEWRHYREKLSVKGKKAVDVVAFRRKSEPLVCWLIEVKDFRTLRGEPDPSNIGGLAHDVAQKVSDTVEGLADASARAEEAAERAHAERSLRARSRAVVLHVEVHAGRMSYLFPGNFPVNVFQKLKQLLGGDYSGVLLLNMTSTEKYGVPWSATDYSMQSNERKSLC